MRKAILTLASTLLLTFILPTFVHAQKLDELSLENWKLLRETERYQMKIAEGYFDDKKWSIALDEYNKFLELYDKSDGAPHAQLRWSLCQVNLRKHNTAIKDGFQSVIDYWPDSAEATAAAYYIGHTYKSIGQIPKAKPAFRTVLDRHPNHLVAVYAMWDLVDIATLDKDNKTRLELLRKLTFDVKRDRATQQIGIQASQQLASLSFELGTFEEGQKALATTYGGIQLPIQTIAYVRGPLTTMLGGTAESKTKAEKMADAGVAFFRSLLPGDQATDDAKAIARQNWYAITDLYAMGMRDDKVLETFQQQAKAMGPSDEALGRLAAFYKSRNKYEDARTTYRKYADVAAGLGAVAYSYREQANYDSAVQTYNQLMNQDAQNALKWKAEIAVTYRSARKFKQAADTYNELITLDSAKANAWRWEMSNTLRDGGLYKEAIANYRQCDNFPENYKQMANCHRHLKEYKEAIMLYGQIVGTDPGNAPWALLQAGYTREEAGEKEQAIQTFQAVCKKFPKDPQASTAHAHLQNKYKISVTLGGAKDEGTGK